MIMQLYAPFRHWSEKGAVFIISDTHFADEDCLYMDPHWITPEEQVALLNKAVGKNDTLIHLGDVGDERYLRRLRAGRKILIKGNHDRVSVVAPYFDEVYDGPLFITPKILLSHEPIEGLPFCLNIHGHDHGAANHDTGGGKHINLAANICGYQPLNLGKLIKEGGISDIRDIHRMTIDAANENPLHKTPDVSSRIGIRSEEPFVIDDIFAMRGMRLVFADENS